MTDLARAAGLTRKTVYARFRSREDLLLQLHTQGLRRRGNAQISAMAAVDSGLDKIRAWGEAFVRYGRFRPLDIRLQAYLESRGVDKMRCTPQAFTTYEAQNHRLAERLGEAFVQGKVERIIRRDLNVACHLVIYTRGLQSILIDRTFVRFGHEFIGTYLRGIGSV